MSSNPIYNAQGEDFLLAGEVDPTSVAIEAKAGSLFLKSGPSPAIYQKQDGGNTTNWLELAVGDFLARDFSNALPSANDIDLNSNKVVNLADPTDAQDGSTKAYTDAGDATVQANVDANAVNIATNTSDIATNAASIATNTSDIATNAANIATNTSDIATNAANIATNTSNIANKLDLSGGTITGNIVSTSDNQFISGDGMDQIVVGANGAGGPGLDGIGSTNNLYVGATNLLELTSLNSVLRLQAPGASQNIEATANNNINLSSGAVAGVGGVIVSDGDLSIEDPAHSLRLANGVPINIASGAMLLANDGGLGGGAGGSNIQCNQELTIQTGALNPLYIESQNLELSATGILTAKDSGSSTEVALDANDSSVRSLTGSMAVKSASGFNVSLETDSEIQLISGGKIDASAAGEGLVVPSLAADPGAPDPGMIWYNTTTGELKVNAGSGVVVLAS